MENLLGPVVANAVLVSVRFMIHHPLVTDITEPSGLQSQGLEAVSGITLGEISR